MKVSIAALGLLLLPAAAVSLRAQSLATPSFDVVSVKPNKSGSTGMRIMIRPGGGFKAENTTLKALICNAWNVLDFQISGGPSWIDSDHWDVEAKGGPGDGKLRSESEEERKAAVERRLQMLQQVLADRFKLTLHKESKEGPIYALVIAKSGAKIKELPPEEKPAADSDEPGKKSGYSMRMGPGELSANGMKIENLVGSLSNVVDRKIVDRTGLKGEYKFELKWAPDSGVNGGGASGQDVSGPSLFTALQEQLGLKLEPQKGAVDLLVIDHVEKASEN